MDTPDHFGTGDRRPPAPAGDVPDPPPGSPAAPTRTTCPYCGVGCGVLVERAADGAHTVRGDPAHPANLGRLCSKGAALVETLALEDRLSVPSVAGCRTDWDSALNLVAARFRQTIDEHGPGAVALYVSGQLLTEDYYAANKLVKGWFGNANIDTNSRLCMASSVAGHRRGFGTDTVPGTYEDLELADLVVLVGSNLAWCHPVLFQRLQGAREARPDMRIVLIDPRRTATAELADVHLALAPDSDLALFGGLLRALDERGAIDRDWTGAHVDGLDETLASVADLDLAAVAALTGLEPGALDAFYALFARTERVVTVYSQGVNQGARGTDTVGSILDCHLATGRIGRPGCGPFSITGQPNAMGGREVGGLANTLAAHAELDDPAARERVRAFWGSPGVADAPGPKAVELFERVGSGSIRALWILATNPTVSLPDADRVREALAACPFVVVSDVAERVDTAAFADVLLPSRAWGEKDGTVTNSERRVSRQRAFRPAPGEARPDWWQIAEVARRLGFARTDGAPAFAWTGPAEVFREHAALSGAAGSADFDITGAAALDDAAYDAMAPFQWPWPAKEAPAGRRFFADGAFHTPTGRGRMWPIAVARDGAPPAAAIDVDGVGAPSGRGPGVRLTLNTGRIRDQWHTMTRTGRVARLAAHLAEPFAEIAPADAARLGLGDADVVELRAGGARVRLRALITPRQRPGSAFAPMHWSDAWASDARVDSLVPPVIDPISGQPASKSAAVSAARWPASAYAFVASVARFDDPARDDYWALAPAPRGWRLELASTDPVDALGARAEALLDGALGRTVRHGLDEARLEDVGDGRLARLVFDGERLLGAAFVAPAPVAVARRWLVERLGEALRPAERHALLAGRPPADRPDPGATVCGCFEVGVNPVRAAIAEGCATVASVGERLRAGTNCGSCRPEIARLIREAPSRADTDPGSNASPGTHSAPVRVPGDAPIGA